MNIDKQYWNTDNDCFLLNEKDWHVIYLPSGKSKEAQKNADRIGKVIQKIIKGIKKEKLVKLVFKKDRPSPGESATLFKEGNKMKGNDGNMYVVVVDKNGTKRWKKYFVEKKDRPSPARSATLYKEGTKMKGNDGNMYVVVVDKNGTKKWKKYIK